MNDDFWRGYMMGSSDSEGSSGCGGDGSGFIAFFSVIGGLILEAMFFVSLGIEIDSVPGILLVIGWVIGTFIASVVLMFLFGR